VVSISELISAVRGELEKAQTEGEGTLAVKEIELTVKGGIKESDSVGGGFKFYVFSAKASASAEEVVEHTVKIRIEPRGSQGMVVGRSPDARKEVDPLIVE